MEMIMGTQISPKHRYKVVKGQQMTAMTAAEGADRFRGVMGRRRRVILPVWKRPRCTLECVP